MKTALKLVENNNPDAEQVTFAQFWAAYPRKVAKKDAEKAWIRVPTAAHEKILRAVEAFKKSDQWIRDGGRFIPHAATWLNGERWEDELEVEIETERCAWNRNGTRGPGGQCEDRSTGTKNGQPYCKKHLEMA